MRLEMSGFWTPAGCSPAIHALRVTCVSHFLSASEKGVRSTLVHFLHDLLLAREPFIQLKQLLLVKLAISDISTFLSLILMPVSRGLSSERIIPLRVRPSVRAVRPSVPLLGKAQNLRFCSILSENSKTHQFNFTILSYGCPENASYN